MSDEQETAWEFKYPPVTETFAQNCAELKRSNPYDRSALEVIINDLMTELWDRGFSQTEIRSAFEKAVLSMPRYAAGLERRSDGPH